MGEQAQAIPLSIKSFVLCEQLLGFTGLAEANGQAIQTAFFPKPFCKAELRKGKNRWSRQMLSGLERLRCGGCTDYQQDPTWDVLEAIFG